MKKLYARFIILVLCAILGVGVYATDTTTTVPPDATIEVSSDAEIVVTDTSTFDAMLEGLMNSSFWTTTGLIATAVIACVATFRKYFGFIADLISKKADEKAISEALKKASEEMSETFNSKLTQIEGYIGDTASNEKILVTILSIFITNANINPNAKAEVMKYLTGLKDVSGRVEEIVETANKIIADANAAEEKEPTPALDSLVEDESEMILG
jgi:vacuolar-type H+-ATPase subunit H